MTRVVLDADFISSFLKIDRLTLIQDYYRTEFLLIPPAVRREVGWTQLSTTLENLAWVPSPVLIHPNSRGAQLGSHGGIIPATCKASTATAAARVSTKR